MEEDLVRETFLPFAANKFFVSRFLVIMWMMKGAGPLVVMVLTVSKMLILMPFLPISTHLVLRAPILLGESYGN